MPNTLDYTEKGEKDKIQDTDYPWKDNFEFNGNIFGLSTIKRLEKETGYNFFSNLPAELQDAIEGRDLTEIRTKLNFINPAPLMAAKEELLSGITTISPLRSFYDNSTGHSSAPNQVGTSTNHTITGVSAFEIGSSKNSIIERSNLNSREVSTTGIHMIQDTSPQVSVIESTPIQTSPTQISIADNGFTQITAFQENTAQIGSDQIGSDQINLIQVSPPQVNISQNHTVKIEAPSTIFGATKPIESVISQLDTSEVSFPISISLQQLLSSNLPDHYLHSSLVNTFKDNPLNLTPLDNSEFTQPLTHTAFHATPDSPAHGKYDLLTTILHETAHLLGIINGNPGFDQHIQTINN